MESIFKKVKREEHQCSFLARYRFLVYALLFTSALYAQTPEQLLQEADQALQKQDFIAAARALEPYLHQKPDDYRAQFNLAYAYSLSGRKPDAIENYKAVLAHQPDLLPAHLNLGILLLEANHPDEAESHLRAVVEKEPDNATADLRLAEALALLKRVPEASEAYERVLKRKPNDPRVHISYAKLLEQSNPALAEQHYRRAIQLAPSLEEAPLDLAALLEVRAANDSSAAKEASEIYRKLLQAHPERRDLRVHMGELFAAQKQFPAAAEQFEMARAAGDLSLPLARQLLNVYLNASSESKESSESYSAKALLLVQNILAQDEQNTEMHLLSGKLRMDRKEYGAAAEEFNLAAKLEPQSVEPYTNMASAFYLAGEYAAALGALVKVSELDQDTAGTYFLRAICLDKLHVRKPALENYQRFLSLDTGKNPDQEFQARQRSKTLTLEIQKGMGGSK